MARPQTILIADPDPDFLDWTTHQLSSSTTRVITTSDSEEAYRLFMKEKPDVLMAETHLSPIGGMELMARIRQRDSNAVVVLTSAFGTTQAVIESMRLGAFDFVRKETLPFNLRAVMDAALKAQAEMKAATSAKPQLTVEEHQDSLVGKSEAMAQVFKMVGRVSLSDAPVMITGESGSGKELVARAVHTYSQRNGKSFVAINCAAIPEQLLESELFGHEKGAFTGAVTQRAGRFEQSHGGTLFLDEIGDMPIQLQSKILRVLQDGEFSRVGGTATLKSDVRIVAATNKNLEQEVTEKKFREDLFYRLNVVRIQLPPLRQRTEDIRLLAEYFLQRVAIRLHLPKLKLSEDAMKVLEGYSWPGNVRELENTIQRACVLATSDVLLPKDIPLGLGLTQTETELPAMNPSLAGVVTKEMAIDALFKAAEADPTLQLLPWLEREFTLHSMRMTNGNQVRSAKLLGITRATLRKRLEIFGITRELNIS
ncbi:MAG: sigma-54 dependent transcriptional regulator [Verrucomicrobiota bacterium]